MTRRHLRPLLVVPGVVPFVLVAIGVRRLVPVAGDAVARRLVSCTSVLASEPNHADVRRSGEIAADSSKGVRTEAHFAADEPVLGAAPLLEVDGASFASRGARGESSRARREKAPHARQRTEPNTDAGRRHIAVSQERLLRLTASQLRSVGWATAVDAEGRAVGVRLSDVGALGVGLADGDVVTSINGRPTATAGDATSAGTAAWASGAPAVHAIIVRGGQTIAVTLELPSGAARKPREL